MSIEAVTHVGNVAVADLPTRLGLASEIDRLREFIDEWIDAGSEEIREMLKWQLKARSKYFRPFTIFACHRAVSKVTAILQRR